MDTKSTQLSESDAYQRSAEEILAALGDLDPAIDSLYATYRQRNPMMIFAGVLPGLDPLRKQRRLKWGRWRREPP